MLPRPHVGNAEVEVPTDLLAGLLMEQASAAVPSPRATESLSAKIFAVMALTTLLTFGTLVSGYELLFSHSLFA